MSKLNEIKELMQKVCDMTVSKEELSDIRITSDEKKVLVKAVDDVRNAKELQRLREIIRKVEHGETLIQGGIGS